MPVSGFEAIPPHMTRVVSALAPSWGKRQRRIDVLDLGVGTGQWGFLLRNYLDYAQGRLKKSHWRLNLIGVEGFQKYRNPAWSLYDNVIVGDIRHELANLERRWRFINMIEVLEHFEREDGERVLRWIADHSDYMMFSFANGDQGAWGGNELERHRSKWSIESLQALLPGSEVVSGDPAGAYLWRKNV